MILKMHSTRIFMKIVVTFLLCKKVGSIDVGPVLQHCFEDWNKKEHCCMPTLPEDFKNCVTQKRRSLPDSSLGFKSISCQCHATPVITEIRTRTSWVQTFRQCLLTGEEYKDHAPAHSGKELFQACKDGDLPAVQRIISSHPEKINARNKHNLTPLMVAAKIGLTDVFNFLFCFDCKLNTLGKFDKNLLHYACTGGSVEIVKRLLSLGLFNIDSKGSGGKTPLHHAISYGQQHVAELLYQSGCDIMVVDRWENNILHMACKSKSIQTLKYVMDISVFSLESRTINGKTPLLVASRKGFFEGCKYLILQGADVTAVNKYNKSLMHHVLHDYNDDNVVRLMMMSYFLSIPHIHRENRGQNGETPLLMATRKGYFRMFKLLVKGGCGTTAVDKDGDTILHLATKGNSHYMVKHILNKGYVSPLSKGAKGRTALMVAARYGYIRMFDLLVKKGCDVRAIDDDKRNVLHWACKAGFTEIIEHILLENKLDIDSRDWYGYSPLMLAIKYDHIPAFMLLQKRGASTSLRDNKGNTILHLACIKGSQEIVQVLIKLDIAKPFTQEKNAKGETPKQILVAKGNDFDSLLF